MNRTVLLVALLANVSSATIAARCAGSQTATTQDTSTTKRLAWLRFGVALGPGVTWRHLADGSAASPTSLGLVGGVFRGATYGPGQRAGLIPAFKLYLSPMKTAAVDV